ncbi:hypothetical protein LTR09_006510 [Extremus antarcticus]|uniref:Uncharacterized protein n=1 Tax=Extremus antarcticus TaxID=702011 RepID=A0AAJ0DKU2_9PEZI|nr:hypothetical protein LTR09_006510 [Extremus antarcticus]
MSSVARVEEETTLQVTIATDFGGVDLTKCESQEHSPLFRLPAEIRNMIFFLATRPDYKSDNIYTKYMDRQPFHLDDSLVQQYHTTLLQTCRLAWLETNKLPMQGVTHHFYNMHEDGPVFSDRGAASIAAADHHYFLWLSLTPNGRRNFYHIHHHANVCRVSCNHDIMAILLRPSRSLKPFPYPPAILTLTLRHDHKHNRINYRSWLIHLVTTFVETAADLNLATVRLELEAEALEVAEFKSAAEDYTSLIVVRGLQKRPPVDRRIPSRLVLQLPIEERSALGTADEIGPGASKEPSDKRVYRACILTWK